MNHQITEFKKWNVHNSEKVISVFVEPDEVPSDQLKVEEPELLNASNCQTYPCDNCDFEFDEEDD